MHHLRKLQPGLTATIDDFRGGSALRGTARFNRVLAGMTKDEALKARVEDHRYYFRIAEAESNFAPPSAEVNRWFRKASVQVPNGEWIGAVERWEWPDDFEGLSNVDANRVRDAVRACPVKPRASVQADGWVGHVVAGVLGLNASDKHDKERIKGLIKTWIEKGVLAIERVKNRKGDEVPVIVAGPNCPIAVS